VKKLLEKAGSHMEDTLVASYLALIIGYLIHEDKDHEKIVRQWMPENNFSAMVAVLKKFFNFMNLTASVSKQSDVVLLRHFTIAITLSRSRFFLNIIYLLRL
jgi:hypothetical protein